MLKYLPSQFSRERINVHGPGLPSLRALVLYGVDLRAALWQMDVQCTVTQCYSGRSA